MSDDRRQTERTSTYGRARLDRRLLAYVRDLSMGGARLSMVSDVPVEPGHVLRARIVVTDQEPVEVEGDVSVIWVERVGSFQDIGVGFVEADEADLSSVVDAVAQMKGAGHGDEPYRGVHVELMPDGDD